MKTLKERLTLNKSGVVLMSVMIILLVMTIIISGVVFITVANLENSQKTASHTETFYVAEGGVNYLTQTFETFYKTVPTTTSTTFFTAIDNFAATYPINNKQIVSFSNNKGKISEAQIWITPLTVTDPSVHRYQIFSDGYIGNIKRTLSKIVEFTYINGGLAFNDAVLAVGSMDIGGAYIDGTIQTTSTATPAIVFRGGTVDGVYIPTGTVPTAVVASSNYNSSIPGLGTAGIYQQDPPTFNPITVLTAPSTTTKLRNKTFTSGGKSYQIINNGDFSITSSTDLTVPTTYNLGDENPGQSVFYVSSFIVTQYAPNFIMEINRDITIVTDTLQLGNQFKVTGSGKLTIFVKPFASSNSTNTRFQLNAGGRIIGNQADSTKMSIYVGALTYNSGSSQLPWTLVLGSGTYYFSLLCANLNIDLADSTLKGAVATNGANVFIGPSSASSAILLYAPLAVVTMKSSSSSFYGAILAGSFVSSTGNSHPTIVYSSAVNTYIPVDVIDLSGMTTPPTISIVKSPTLE